MICLTILTATTAVHFHYTLMPVVQASGGVPENRPFELPVKNVFLVPVTFVYPSSNPNSMISGANASRGSRKVFEALPLSALL